MVQQMNGTKAFIYLGHFVDTQLKVTKEMLKGVRKAGLQVGDSLTHAANKCGHHSVMRYLQGNAPQAKDETGAVGEKGGKQNSKKTKTSKRIQREGLTAHLLRCLRSDDLETLLLVHEGGYTLDLVLPDVGLSTLGTPHKHMIHI